MSDWNLERVDAMLAKQNFERLGLIGRGPATAVYQCHDYGRRRDLVLKVWTEDDPVGLDAENLHRSWGRARDLMKIQGKSPLVPIQAVAPSGRFILGSLMERNLRPRLGDAPLDPERARSLLREGLKALAFLHEGAKRLHGAIKPSNLLIDAQGRLRLGDAMGIPLLFNSCIQDHADLPPPPPPAARLGDDEYEPPDGPGYPASKYLYPELLNPGFGPVGKWVDQYGLGFVMLELMAGPRFDEWFAGVGDDTVDPVLGWLRWHGSTAAPPAPREVAPGIPDDLAEVVARLTCKSVGGRYSDVLQALQALERPSDRIVSAAPPRPSPPLSPISASPPTPIEDRPLQAWQGHADSPAILDARANSPAFAPSRNPFQPVEPEPGSWAWFARKAAGRRSLGTTIAMAAAPVVLLLAILILGGSNADRVVRIETDPPGATVEVDGRPLAGQTTPVELAVAPGSHSIELFLDGHESKSVRAAEVPDGAGKFVLGPYELKSSRRRLEISSIPRGARIVFDGRPTPVLTDGAIDVKLGDHELTLTLAGYEPYVSPVAIHPGSTPVKMPSARLVARPRTVTFASEPPGARVEVDGRDLGATPLRARLETGGRRVRVVLEGFRAREFDLDVEPSDDVLEAPRASLEPIEVRTRLVLASAPPGASVTIRRAGGGGEARTAATPAELDVEPGVGWVLAASFQGRRRLTREVAPIAPGETARVDFDLRAPGMLTNSLGMTLVYVPPGEFTMGSDAAASGPPDETPAHAVRIARGFYAATTEVTTRQYYDLMGTIPSHFQTGRQAGLDAMWDRPVERVSHDAARDFCRKLDARDGLPAGSYRLPTEAEWEYMAVAGGSNPSDGWFKENSGKRTQPVGRLKPNSLGLFDMLGNVDEWTEDWYGSRYYAESPYDDPPGPARTGRRVVRGGSWKRTGLGAITRRNAYAPNMSFDSVGFRVIRNEP
jgi:formylglycine-generating enzyme required for sulfatase activity